MVFITAFNNISVTSWGSGLWCLSGDKHHKPDPHDVTEILLKAVINTINLTTTM
jgi:hypothetical protein